MSPAVAAVPDSDFVEAAVPLLKEYAEKLAGLSREAALHSTLVHPTAAARDELIRRWKHLRAPSEELARQASAVVEEGRVNDLEKVQLWLRLAEFEHYLATAQEAVGRLTASK